MSKNRTIIYYTANREKEAFERKVRKNIQKAKGKIPLISVSQKPIRFGKNICIGRKKQSYLNAFKQCLIGCKAAKTPFVIMTEDDCLYPKAYFDFEPKDINTIYSYDNVWLMWNRENRTRFYKHGTTHGSLIYGRKFIIALLERAIKEELRFSLYKPEYKWELFHGDDPIINIKTRQGISFGTTLTKGVNPVVSFPLWGTVEDVKRNYEI